MSDDVDERLWLPLLILDTTGDLHSKTKFQKIAFLVQYESKFGEYDFIKHHYGPYSDGLDLDTACYPSLITQSYSQSYYTPSGRNYYSYHITEHGKNVLSKLKEKIKPDVVQTIVNNVK